MRLFVCALPLVLCVCARSQVLELLREGGGEAFDTMCLLRTLGQVKTDVVDVVDGKKTPASKLPSGKAEGGTDTREVKGEEGL